ncbi:MAG: hypothetical protein JWM56_358 [Candidatus Peribacteria bacterium]|nr:hypothetical protein [Candidatus Peribacteria bacterium]
MVSRYSIHSHVSQDAFLRLLQGFMADLSVKEQIFLYACLILILRYCQLLSHINPTNNAAFIERMDSRFAKVDSRFEQIDNRLGSLEGKMDTLTLGVDSIDARLDAMKIEKLPQRVRVLEARL